MANYRKQNHLTEFSDGSDCDDFRQFSGVKDTTAYDSDPGESDCDEVHGGKEALFMSRKRRRRRKKVVTICTSNSRYEVVRRVAYRLGMREVSEDDTWNLYWTDLSISMERCKEMKRFQKVNHFPGMSEICRKDLLARNLNRMLKHYPEDYTFFPKSWCLPHDMADLLEYSRSKKNKTFILKPDVGCQGRGIIITKSMREVGSQEKMICQIYISRPFLIDGYKFDLRLYTLITSCDPLRIYVFNDGLARFATSRYKEPTGGNSGNMFMHLTNYAVNKNNRMYVVDDESGSKRKVSTLNRWFEAKGYNVTEIWNSIDDVIIKTVIAAHPTLKHSYTTCFPTHDYTYACFELLGFDVLLDENLVPYVLEVNHSPSFHTDSQIDRDIKEGLLHDTFHILNLQQCDKKKIIEEDRKRVRNRLLKGIHKDHISGEFDIPASSPLALQTEWEEAHKGNFRKVYPCEGQQQKYEKFFHQHASSLFQDTAASRAREEASRIQREESSIKVKKELARRGTSGSNAGARPESPRSKPSLRVMRQIQLANSFCNSFEPTNIVEAEEMERVYQLNQREFLVKSYGLIDQIYQCLKKNRVLKSNFPSKLPISAEFSQDKRLGKLIKETEKVPSRLSTEEDAQPDTILQESIVTLANEKNLCVWSNEAPISIRPIPGARWPFLPAPNLQARMLPLPVLPAAQDVRSTKAHVARSYTNNAKLRQLERIQNRVLRPT